MRYLVSGRIRSARFGRTRLKERATAHNTFPKRVPQIGDYQKQEFISAIVPMYNEEEHCRYFFFQLGAALFKLVSINFEIIVPIGGNDRTYEILSGLAKDFSQLKIFYDAKRGLGRGLVQGFNFISPWATHVLTMDTDGSHKPDQIQNLWANRKFSHIVIGCRSKKFRDTRPLKKKIISKVTNWLLRKYMGAPISDFTSDFRLYRSEVIRAVLQKIKQKNFEAVPEILFRAKEEGFGLITETPIDFEKRQSGESKLGWHTVLGYLQLLVRLSLRMSVKYIKKELQSSLNLH